MAYTNNAKYNKYMEVNIYDRYCGQLIDIIVSVVI